MTIFVTWQLIVTLDSIRNSCDVLTMTVCESVSQWVSVCVCLCVCVCVCVDDDAADDNEDAIWQY